MITINQTVLANNVILDSNSTIISLTSSNGIGYFFRALIYINDVLFDTQGWSRQDAYTTNKDLKDLYKAYFENEFVTSFTSGLTEVTSLKKKVSITIQEIQVTTGSVIQTLNLPEFFIMYNAKPIHFNNNDKLIVLGLDPEVISITKNGKITIPFYVNASSEDVVVTLKNNLGFSINSVSQTGVVGKKVYQYNYDLSGTTINDDILYLDLEVSVGATTVSKTYRIFRHDFFNFDVKEIAFKNIFGLYVYAYLDGQLTVENSLDIKSYQQQDYSDKVYEIDEEQTYTINSGSLVEVEKALISQIATSIDIHLNYMANWYRLVPKLKKVSEYKDRNHSYSENFSFKAIRNSSILNTAVGEFETYFVITNVVYLEGNSYNIFFDINFTTDSITPIFRKDISSESGIDLFTEITSPQVLVIDFHEGATPPVSFLIKLSAEFGGTTIETNEYSYTP